MNKSPTITAVHTPMPPPPNPAFPEEEHAWAPFLNPSQSRHDAYWFKIYPGPLSIQIANEHADLIKRTQLCIFTRDLSVASRDNSLPQDIRNFMDNAYVRKKWPNVSPEDQRIKNDHLDQLEKAITASLEKKKNANIIAKLTYIGEVISHTHMPTTKSHSALPHLHHLNHQILENTKQRISDDIKNILPVILTQHDSADDIASYQNALKVMQAQCDRKKITTHPNNINQLIHFIQKYCAHNDNFDDPDNIFITTLCDHINGLKNLPNEWAPRFLKHLYKQVTELHTALAQCSKKLPTSSSSISEQLSALEAELCTTKPKKLSKYQRKKASRRERKKQKALDNEALIHQQSIEKNAANTIQRATIQYLRPSIQQRHQQERIKEIVAADTIKQFIQASLSKKKEIQAIAAIIINSQIRRFLAQQQLAQRQQSIQINMSAKRITALFQQSYQVKQRILQHQQRHPTWLQYLSPLTQAAVIAARRIIAPISPTSSTALFGSRLAEGTCESIDLIHPDNTDTDLITLLPPDVDIETFIEQLHHAIDRHPTLECREKEHIRFPLPNGQGRGFNCEILYSVTTPANEKKYRVLDLTFIIPITPCSAIDYVNKNAIPLNRYATPILRKSIAMEMTPTGNTVYQQRQELINELINPSFPETIPLTPNNIRNFLKMIVRNIIARQHSAITQAIISLPLFTHTYPPHRLSNLVKQSIITLFTHKPDFLEKLLFFGQLHTFYFALQNMLFQNISCTQENAPAFSILDLADIAKLKNMLLESTQAYDFESQHYQFLMEGVKSNKTIHFTDYIDIATDLIHFIERMYHMDILPNQYWIDSLLFLHTTIPSHMTKMHGDINHLLQSSVFFSSTEQTAPITHTNAKNAASSSIQPHRSP